MIKKTVTYMGYDGLERTEEFYFNYSEKEVIMLESSVNGGLSEKLRKMASCIDAPSMMNAYEEFILGAYGEKGDDGRHFIKVRNGVKLSEEFAQTEAYSQIFMEIISDPDKAAEFINGVMPPKRVEVNAKVASD